MPVIIKACGEEEFSYEYRHGVTSYGAFTYCLAKTFRKRRQGKLTWTGLVDSVGSELKTLEYAQQPGIDGPSSIVRSKIPWKLR